MVGQQNRRQQQDNHFLSGLFNSANGGNNFFAQLIAMFSAFFNNANGGFFANLFGNNATPTETADSAPRSFYSRGRDTIVNGFNQVGRVLGEGLDAVKNLIARAESADNYHRVYAGREVKHMPLSDMTVNEVLAWQKQHTNEDGYASSAAGRYQIIRKTLEGLKTEMGLTGNEKFDADLQDRMFLQLARRRGLDEFLNKPLTNSSIAEFTQKLSMEWAGVAKDASGLSYYHGDGLNKASISYGEMRQALIEAHRSANATQEVAPGTALASNTPAPAASPASAVAYKAAERTGQTLATTPRISAQYAATATLDASTGTVAAANTAPALQQREPAPVLMSPSLGMS